MTELDFSKLSTDDLKDQFRKLAAVTVASVIKMGQIWKALEDRGEDVSDLGASTVKWLRLVAYGQLLPEIGLTMPEMVIKVAGQLPKPDQRQIADNKPLTVVHALDGTLRAVPARSLSRAEVAQVFAPDHIRDANEQLSWLKSRSSAPVRAPAKIDTARHGWIIKGCFFPAAELQAMADQCNKTKKK